ncbi:hypothetical protein FRC03_009778 [Tulasnella sp. 419]|nr:hypothetical protein FRC03_009778 [Tulasnella sp. 419]
MGDSCPHLAILPSLSPPKLSQSVHREECTQCFDNQDLPVGIDVCLTCFNGGCINEDRHHASTHFDKSTHPLALNVKRTQKTRPKRDDKEPPLKRLAILEEREEDKYAHQTVLKCWGCGGIELPGAMADPKVKTLADGIMQSMSSARQSEVKAWEEEILACEHTLTLDQSSSAPIPPSGLAQCKNCELKENLWLCLTCGNLGCGRQQYLGIGGKGHGLAHFNESGHPVSVKLGTITAEGTADVYCYRCEDSKIDPELAAHLASFGINILTQTKTEKSITEMQIEHNLSFDFSMTGEDGKSLQPVFGPGLTGLANLGNSCYMASVLQALYVIPAFQERYLPTASLHALICPEPLPASCLDCQMHKIADGLLSGRYSHPRPSDSETSEGPNFQEGIKPTMFKALIGKGHEEFSTMRQQDSEEFLGHLLKILRQNDKKKGSETVDGVPQPTEVFKFGVEQRLQCGECKKVRYRVDSQDVASVPVPAKEKGTEEDGKKIYEPVEMMKCLEMFTGTEALEYHCPSCSKTVIATKQNRFATFPDILVVHAKKFQLVNWVPQKLDIPVLLPSGDVVVLDGLLGRGRQDGEVELPEEAAPAPSLPEFNEAALGQLQAMGFGLIPCQKALLATGNTADAEVAMNWLFEHMEDPDINDPLVLAPSGGGAAGPEPSADQIAMLADMGFTSAQARKALKETSGNAERAVEWLFNHPDDMGDDATSSAVGDVSVPKSTTHPGGSATLPAKYKLKAFISHKGPSVHSGHYVAHIRHDDLVGGWVLFNDEKVVKADGEEALEMLKSLAYLFVFERAT